MFSKDIRINDTDRTAKPVRSFTGKLDLLQSLLQISPDIVNVFNSYGQA